MCRRTEAFRSSISIDPKQNIGNLIASVALSWWLSVRARGCISVKVAASFDPSVSISHRGRQDAWEVNPNRACVCVSVCDGRVLCISKQIIYVLKLCVAKGEETNPTAGLDVPKRRKSVLATRHTNKCRCTNPHHSPCLCWFAVATNGYSRILV